jgi:hypothetical protein
LVFYFQTLEISLLSGANLAELPDHVYELPSEYYEEETPDQCNLEVDTEAHNCHG